ncbi:MAG: hypothetical protein ABF289_09480 [Clostridiales bacterium]
MYILFDTAFIGITILLKAVIYFSLGIVKIFFSTKQEKITFLLILVCVWVDAYIIYPDVEYWIHLLIFMLPIAYLIKIGRSC